MPCALSSRSSASSSRIALVAQRARRARAGSSGGSRRGRASARSWRCGAARRRPRERRPSRRAASSSSAREARHVADAAVVGDVHARRLDTRACARSSGASASGWNCTGVVVGMIQAPAAVSNSRYDRPKVSPVKKPRLRCVPDAVVVHRVAGRVEEASAAGRRARSSCRRCVAHHALASTGPTRRRTSARSPPRRRRAVALLIRWRRVDQVTRAARMDDQPRARAACCISRPTPPAWSRWTWVGDDVVDRRRASSPAAAERGEQARHRVVRAGVDERRAAALDDRGRRRRRAAGESPCRRRRCRGAQPFDEVRREARGEEGSFTRSDVRRQADAQGSILESRLASGENGSESRIAPTVSSSCESADARSSKPPSSR